MKTKSLNKLKFHIRRCHTCKDSQVFEELCSHIQDYAAQDFIARREAPLSNNVFEKRALQKWVETESSSVNLSVLTELQKQLIYLYYWERLSTRQIADQLKNIPKSSVHDQLKKALQVLRQTLQSTQKGEMQ